MVIYTTVTLEREFDPTLEISLKRSLFPKKLTTTINHLHFKKSLFWSFCFAGVVVCKFDLDVLDGILEVQTTCNISWVNTCSIRFCQDSYTSIDMLNRQFPQLCKRNAWWLDDRLDVSIPSRVLLSR